MITVSPQETRRLYVSVLADGDPSSGTAEIAVVDPGGSPASADWKPATLESSNGRWAAWILVGPGGAVQPPAGTYAVWLRVSQPGGEVFVAPVEILRVQDIPLRIVQPAEVARYAGRDMSLDDETWLGSVIDHLTAELEAWLRRPVRRHQRVTRHVLRSGQTRIILEATPVVSVAQVRFDPDSATPTVADPRSYAVHPWGVDFGPTEPLLPFVGPIDAPLWVDGRVVEVTYTGGLDGVADEAIRGAVVRAAAREWLMRLNDMQGLQSMTVEGTTYTPVQGAGAGGFVPEDLQRLASYRRPVVG